MKWRGSGRTHLRCQQCIKQEFTRGTEENHKELRSGYTLSQLTLELAIFLYQLTTLPLCQTFHFVNITCHSHAGISGTKDDVSCYVLAQMILLNFLQINFPRFEALLHSRWDCDLGLESTDYSSDCSTWFLTSPLMILILKCLQHTETSVHLQEVFKYLNIKSLAKGVRTNWQRQEKYAQIQL
jgi:hypothetical protein